MNIQWLKSLSYAIFATCMLSYSLPSNSEIVVIVNSKNPIASMSKSDLNRIFLGKSSTFTNGSAAIAINQHYSSETRTLFDKKYLRKTPQQSKAFWSKQLFTGEGTPPQEVPGDLDVLQKVAKEQDMIGYIDSSAVNKAVKVIAVK